MNRKTPTKSGRPLTTAELAQLKALKAKLLAELKAALLPVPAQLGKRLAAEHTVTGCARILKEALRPALAVLERYETTATSGQ